MPELETDLATTEADQTSEESSESTEFDESAGTDEADESEEQTSEETQEDDSEETDEGEVGFDEWKKQYELPDDITSEHELAEKYQALLKRAPAEMSPQMQQVDAILKARGQGGVQALLSGEQPGDKQPQTEQKTESFFTPSPFSSRAMPAARRSCCPGSRSS